MSANSLLSWMAFSHISMEGEGKQVGAEEHKQNKRVS